MKDLDEINQILTNTLATEGKVSSTEVPRARMLGNIRKRISASAPAGTYTVNPDTVDWEPFDQGIERKLLIPDTGDGTETAIYRLEPNAKFVSHEHTHQESCWVVEGDILVGDHLVQAGDMHVAEVGYEHPEICARTHALLLIRSQVYVGPLMEQ